MLATWIWLDVKLPLDRTEFASLVIAKYTTLFSIFSGKSPVPLWNNTFSPFNKVCAPTVNILSTGEEADNFLNELDEASVIKIPEVLAVPITTDKTSFSLAPTLNPCVIAAGLMSFESNPNKYKWVLIPTAVVKPTSRVTQSILSLTDVIALGVIIFVMNALSSFSNASFLNPSDTSANWPKLELELVIDASPPFIAAKCLLYPIANTDTTCIIASLVMVMWQFSHPFL